MSPHAETARDQLRLAQDQLRLLDESAETAHDQLLVFLAAAVVHACVDVAEELRQKRPAPGVCEVTGGGCDPSYAWSAPRLAAQLDDVREAAGLGIDSSHEELIKTIRRYVTASFMTR